MRQNRLRRALLPTWPPENASEAMLLLLCAAALRLLIELWMAPAGAMLAQPDVATAALALLGALARPMALGLLLALAAHVVFKVPPRLALGLGALMLAGTWVLPLASGIARLPPETAIWITVVPVAILALAAAYVVRVGFLRAVLLAVAAPLLAVAVASWDLAHAWALDTLGLSVRGALVFGIAPARREALDAMPLLALCLAAWMLPGGSLVRRMLAPGGEAAPWPLQLGAACAVAWGFVFAGAALGAMPGVLQPPGIYGLAALRGGLGAGAALVAGQKARRAGFSRSPSAGDLGMLAAWALVLSYVSGPLSLLAVALVVALLALDLLLPSGRRPGMATRSCRAAAIAVILWWGGSAIVPGALALSVPSLAGLAAAGCALAGLAAAEGRRVSSAIWILVLGGAVAVLALAAGRGDMLLLCGAMTMVLLLMLVSGRRRPTVCDAAALSCAAMLGAATALHALGAL